MYSDLLKNQHSSDESSVTLMVVAYHKVRLPVCVCLDVLYVRMLYAGQLHLPGQFCLGRQS